MWEFFFLIFLCFSLSVYSYYTQDAHQDFGHREWRFFFFGHNANVEDSWEDEYETRGRCSACKANKSHKVKSGFILIAWQFRQMTHIQDKYHRNLPMTPKIPRIFGAKMTSRLIKVSRMTAMVMCRGQQKVLLGKTICWIALLTYTGKTFTLCYGEVMEKSLVIDLLLQERAQWARWVWRQSARPHARTKSACRTGQYGCRCEAALPPLHLMTRKEN